MKIYAIGSGHMTKMAIIPMYGNLLQNQKANDLGICIVLGMFVQMMVLG